MEFASALSQHPVAAQAVGEVIGQVLEAVGQHPDLALLSVTDAHAADIDHIAKAVDETLRPGVLLGCIAGAVVGVEQEVEFGPAVSLWAGCTGPVVAIDLPADAAFASLAGDAHGDSEGTPASWDRLARTWRAALGDTQEAAALLLLFDPSSFPAEEFLAWADTRFPGTPVVGGGVPVARAGATLILGDHTRHSGAIGALIGAGAGVEVLVSQGCRQIGSPVVVTSSEGHIIHSLAGRRAMDRLLALAHESLTPEEIAVVNGGGLHIGRVVNESAELPGPGDFAIRSVIGADPQTGAIAVGDVIEVGTTVQFHLLDPASADHDLSERLESVRADAALMFTCNGRGTRLFDKPHHDAFALSRAIGPRPVAGFFAAGELAPVHGRNHLHAFSTSLLLFRSSAPPNR